MLLIIDCCIRGADSATRKYYQAYLEASGQQHTQSILLDQMDLAPLNRTTLLQREALCAKKDFGHAMFQLARQFQQADEILVAAPFWDLSFPSILKVYFEHVTVNGLTFGYDDRGRCIGYCKARRLLYFSTCGGYCTEQHLGFTYTQALAAMLGIRECFPYILQGLDIDPTQREALLTRAIRRLQLGEEKTKG